MMLIVLLLNMMVLGFSLQLVHEKNGMIANYSDFIFFWGGGCIKFNLGAHWSIKMLILNRTLLDLLNVDALCTQ
jgi:hypothetical protein